MLKSPLLNAATDFRAPAWFPRLAVASELLGLALFGATTALPGTLTTLYSFSATDPQTHANSDGAYPGGLTLGKDGSFYGTAKLGGAHDGGTVFKITTDGVFTLLYTFTGGASSANSDGGNPGGLAVDASGSFYGVTAYGSNGTGTVFKLSTDGTAIGTEFTTLYTFASEAVTSSPPGGTFPQSILALDGQGNIYGTTEGGGIGTGNIRGSGTVFKITTDGTPAGTALTTLHAFGSLDQFSKYDGAFPRYGLTLGSDGNLYGTTSFLIQAAAATFFQVSPSGVFTTLHVFTLGDHGYPQPSALLEGPAGIFYGMNVSDGDLGLGQLFEFTAGGDYSVIHAFADPPYLINGYAGTNLDGAYPTSWVKASDGSLYGITSTYGTYGSGTLFKSTTDGTTGGTVLTTLYAFSSPYSIAPLPEGAPSGVALGTDGTIYGTMTAGSNMSGAVFRFDPQGVSPLPATTLQIVGTNSPGAPIQFIATQSSTVPGLAVRIQYTTTPTIESSWTDLPDGHGGQLTAGASGLYSFGTVGTTFYPAGTAVYFRAISSAQGFADSISAYKGPYTIEQGNFTINLRLTSTSDPTGKLQVSHVGDTLTYTFIWTNIGNATAHDVRVQTWVPTYIDAVNNLSYQFPSNYLTFNQYGTYTGESKPGAGDAQVTWATSDLPPGSSQAVTLGVRLGAQVRTEQQLGLPNDLYQVYSSIDEPPIAATGYTSGAPNVDSTVLGPIKVTVTPDVTKVAPGGIINYTIKVQNVAGYTARNVVIADPVPEFASFVSAAFINPPPSPVLKVIGKTVANPLRLIGLYPPASRLPEVQAFLAGNPQIVAPSDNADQAVFYVGNLASGATATVRLKVQAQYLDPVDFSDQEIKNFDYLAYFEDPSGNVVQSRNEAGLIFTPVVGAVQKPPDLSMLKLVSAQNVSPGDSFVVGFAAKNSGAAAANDVFIQDLLPQGDATVNPVLLSGSTIVTAASSQALLNSAITFIGTSTSITKSKANYFVTLDPAGAITVHGLHLEPNAALGIYYTLQMPATTPVPESLVAGASFIGAGNGNQTIIGSGTNQFVATTPVGFPQEIPIQIKGNIVLFTPDHPFEAVPAPLVSANPSATATRLDALYKKNTNASLIVPKSNPLAPIPGVQRYFIHYQNMGTNIANDVHLLFSTPPNTEFYRAYFVGKAGLLVPPATGQSISEPLKLGTGNIIFNLGNLTNGFGSGGYVMAEVIISPSAINATNSRVVAGAPHIYQGALPAEVPRKLDDSASNGGTIVYDGQNVPHVGVVKIVPQAIQQDGVFGIECAVFAYGNVDGNQTAEATVQAPAGTEIVYLTGQAQVISSNSTSLDLSLGFINHYATGFTVLFRATGAAHTTIAENSIVVNVPYCGKFTPAPTSIKIVGSQEAIPNNVITTVLGAQFVTLGEMTVIPLGPYQPGVGSALVCGPTGLFGNLQSASDLSDSFGTTLVAGPAQDIPLLKLPVLGNTDTKTALQKLPAIVGGHGGNIFNGPQNNLLAADGESIIDNNTGAIAVSGGIPVTLRQMLRAGAQSVIPSGAGTLPALGTAGQAAVGGGIASGTGGGHVFTSGGGVVSNDGGSVVSNDGGSLISQDGSNLISQDGSNLISQDGSSLVGSSGGTLISSVASASIVASGAGNIVASGAGNIVASGAGN